MQVKELLSILPIYETVNINKEEKINKIEMDSRKVSEGDMFVCIKGFTVDGHDFAEKALEQGASLIVSERKLAIDDAPLVVVPYTTCALELLSIKFFHFLYH